MITITIKDKLIAPSKRKLINITAGVSLQDAQSNLINTKFIITTHDPHTIGRGLLSRTVNKFYTSETKICEVTNV